MCLKQLTMFVILAILLAIPATASAEIVFNQDFDGGYTGTFGTGEYASSPPPTIYTKEIVTTGGNPNGAWLETMVTNDWGNFYAAQMQIMQIYPPVPTDTNPANYEFSFDAKGSYAGNIQLTLQSWQDKWFGGSQLFSVTTDCQLSAADTWQTFSMNLGALNPTINPTGGTWQLAYQLNSWQWGGPNKTDILTVDNVKLTRVPEPGTVSLVVMGLATLWFFRRK
jgi:hypothetical protein